MVTLNFTLFIELALFLTFLWGTSRFILPQVVQLLDARERAIEADHAQAQADIESAQESERQFDREMAAIRRDADDHVRKETRGAINAFAATLGARKTECDAAVADVRAAAMKEVDAQREACETIAPELAKLISEQLGTEGNAK